MSDSCMASRRLSARAPAISLAACFVLQSFMASPVSGVRPRVEAGNDHYRVTINSEESPFHAHIAGYYTMWTTDRHPVSSWIFEDGRMLSWHPGENRAADDSHAGLRSHSSGTDYLLGRQPLFGFEPSPGFECVEANDLSVPTVEQVMVGGEARGVRATWSIVNAGDDLDVELLLLVHGDDMMDGAIEVSLRVRNWSADPLAFGARHAWAIRNNFGLMHFIGLRDEQAPPEPVLHVETRWPEPTARAWEAWGATDHPYSEPWDTHYGVSGLMSAPDGLSPSPTPPDLLLFAEMDTGNAPAIPGLTDHCFETELPDPPRPARLQMAVAPFWGHDADHAIVLDPGGEVTLTQYLMAFRHYPLEIFSDGPWEQPCEGTVTAVPVSVVPAPRHPTDATVHSEWSSSDPRVSFDDPSSPETIARVEGAGSFPIHHRAWVGPWESHLDETIVVTDAQAPRFETLSVSPGSLWPPNHRLHDVRVDWETVDECDPEPRVRLLSVQSDEPQGWIPALGAGNTERDWAGADLGEPDRELQLRAERAGTRGGRTYTLTYAVRDSAGNEATKSVEVRVGHDRGRPRR